MSRRTLVAVVTALALIMSACAADSDATTTTTAADTTTTTETASSDTTTTTTEPALEGPYEHLARAELGEYAGTEVQILAQWIEGEGESFVATLADFADRTGITINYDGVTDYETVLTVRVEGGDTPDIAQIAQPGLMRAFAERGQLVNLSEWINEDQLLTDYSSAWTNQAAHDGSTYGVYFKGDTKSLVWYPVAAFAEAGYEIPETWDELIALSDQILADGGQPWCISIEHGDASGWVGTDWLEDILLRTAPVEIYEQWINHEIPFNHPEVMEAAEIMKDIWFDSDYVLGGNTGINATWVGDTPKPMFDEGGPSCWMHRQASWIADFFPADPSRGTDSEGAEILFQPGEDAQFFYLPPIEEEFGRPVLGGGDMFVMFNDRPEVRAVMEYLATPDAARGWIAQGTFISPNNAVPTDWYTTYSGQEIATILANATTLQFDASDLMPSEVGGGTFWDGMVNWVAANGEGTEEIFQQIEDSWPET
ncbi:MAG TPA: ABC transporter substrate-binding protein [Acidimicrobiia bacterium]|nr:ABC transporter substrate-binding protein [Acidimicrobiia bacterium]